MSDPQLDHFRMMARYNRLANERLYAACAELPDEARKRDRRAFFTSIHGTLNHLMVGDRIWLGRFAGQNMPSTGLDAVLYEDFDQLREARAAEDLRIETFAAGLNQAALASLIEYRNNEGHVFKDPMAVLLAHFYNHQTHHRGQVHDMLSQAGMSTPVLDLHRVLIPSPG